MTIWTPGRLPVGYRSPEACGKLPALTFGVFIKWPEGCFSDVVRCLSSVLFKDFRCFSCVFLRICRVFAMIVCCFCNVFRMVVQWFLCLHLLAPYFYQLWSYALSMLSRYFLDAFRVFFDACLMLIRKLSQVSNVFPLLFHCFSDVFVFGAFLLLSTMILCLFIAFHVFFNTFPMSIPWFPMLARCVSYFFFAFAMPLFMICLPFSMPVRCFCCNASPMCFQCFPKPFHCFSSLFVLLFSIIFHSFPLRVWRVSHNFRSLFDAFLMFRRCFSCAWSIFPLLLQGVAACVCCSLFLFQWFSGCYCTAFL